MAPNINVLFAVSLICFIASWHMAVAAQTVANVTDAPPPNDDLDEDYSDLMEHLSSTRFVVQRILAPLVILFGVVGNSINIAVLTQKVMRTSSTNTYLTALAVFDVLYLIFGLTMSLKHYNAAIVNTPSYIRYRKPFGKPIVDTCSNTAVWITLTFTVERYIGVCHPMKGRSWCTPERARFITLAVCASAAIITFPEFFEFKVVEIVDPMTNITLLEATPTDFGNAQAYQWGYVYMNQALFTFLPLLLLIVFNSLLIRAVMSATKRRKEMAKMVVVQNERQDRQTKEQQKITTMLICVVIVFILCQLPQAIMNLYVTYLSVTQNSSMRTRIKITITNNIFNLLVQVNSSMNFILYSSFSLRFRRVFRRLFCRCLVSRPDRNQLFSEATNDGSKTNLILHAPSTQATCPSPRRPHSSRVPKDTEPPSSTQTKTRNGYLEVDQNASFV